MNGSGVKIELHFIQNFAPSNLNRDDTGQPKSAYFGGFRRARVSSQCGKRAARDWWREHGTVTVGDRTKKLQQLIGDKLALDKEFTKKVAEEEDRRAGIRNFTDLYYSVEDNKKAGNTKVLIFVGPDEVDVCALLIKELWDDLTKQATKKGNLKPQKEIEERIKAAKVSADIALFGRMLAEQPGRNTDGACQVAHPISTHKVDMEMDFYTAVDDLNPDEETGAGMMGIVGYNSACFYRYALVDRDQLARNLARKTDRRNGNWLHEIEGEDYEIADTVIKAFLEAMVYAIPTGKQNSFAAQNLPSFGLFVRRQGGVPISLANAFVKPVRPTKHDDDLVGLSVAALAEHWEATKKVYGDQGIQMTACFHMKQEGRLGELKNSDKGSVEKAIKAIMEVGKIK
ncbi:MAG: type I-E CRISPR-associated protein Cas7/Cse4/CasC [Candidatus Krumholzibacteriota bacterium]|nr:type I-E CRISPR-associated protein Cas7/Cse4/CasC [Candidatus Krumholzibacteriota bacterium]